jgi:dihydropteroate synthase
VTPPIAWQLRGRSIALDRPMVVGIVNVTPDSFSDGGRFLAADAAVSHAARLLEDGADVLDIGGESTRPQGATPVAADEERNRVLPVVRELRSRFPDAVISVDTVKSEVARQALDAGADVINDVSAFRLDPRMGEITAAAGAGVILMHSRGGISEMATFAHASYGADVAAEVFAELTRAAERAIGAGVARESIVLDPGVGFAKRGEHSLAVLAALPRLAAAGFPVMVGVSRKRFIGELTGVTDPLERVHGTNGANVAALARGARLFRVHDVRPARQALDVAWAVLGLGGEA